MTERRDDNKCKTEMFFFVAIPSQSFRYILRFLRNNCTEFKDISFEELISSYLLMSHMSPLLKLKKLIENNEN